MLYPSGLAAITARAAGGAVAGDELLVTDSVYGPTRRFCDTFLKRYGITTRYYDPLVGAGIAELIGEQHPRDLARKPRLADHGGPGRARRSAPSRGERGIVTLLDNTWATPLFFPALAAGVDIIDPRRTKYVGGHADVMLGAATATEQHFAAAPADQLGPRP